jgi:hypothetical protein
MAADTVLNDCTAMSDRTAAGWVELAISTAICKQSSAPATKEVMKAS